MTEILILALYILLLVGLAYFAMQVVDWIGAPSPWNWMLKAVVAICILIVIVGWFTGGIPQPHMLLRR